MEIVDTLPLAAYGKNIILEEIEEKPKEGFLILPDKEENYILARVISIGKEVEDSIEGNIVLISRYGHVEMSFERKEYLICKPENIYATIVD